MWNHAKNSMKQLKRPTSLISHCLPVNIVQNGPKLCKRKRVASACNFFLEVSSYAIWKLTSWRFQKCGCLIFYNSLNPSYSCPKSGQISIFFWQNCGVQKNRYGYNIAIQVKSLNQRGPIPIGTMLIQRFDQNRNIVAVSIFLDTA